MLCFFIVFAVAFVIVEAYLLAVESRRCSKCEWCYQKCDSRRHCIVHDTSPYFFPDEYRKWGKWNNKTKTCIYYKRRK